MKVLDMNAVAKRIGCSKGHVSKLTNGRVADTPLLPCVRLGRSKRVLEETLEQWLKDIEARGRKNEQETPASKRLS
jgi:hypothetical protein